MDHSHDEIHEIEKKDSEGRGEEKEKRVSFTESELLLPLEGNLRETGNIALDGKTEENQYFNDSWGVPLHNFENFSETGSIDISISSHGSVDIPDTTARLKDHSNDYRRSFQQSKHSRHLQAFKYSTLSASVRSNDGEYFMETCTELKTFSQMPSELSDPLGKTHKMTSLKRAASAPIEAAAPPAFLGAKSGQIISEWDLNNNTNSCSDEEMLWRRRRRRRPLASLQRENLMNSLTWFSFHTPKCVLEDLISHELKKSEETFNISIENNNCFTKRSGSKSSTSSDNDNDNNKDNDNDNENGSLSSLSDDESDGKTSSKCINTNSNLNEVDDRDEATTHIVFQKHLPHNTLRMPYNVTRDCALVIVDISGFTKLSTILDEESLSKVINTYFGLLIDEVIKYGGDILKFAGDAFFAEWRVRTKEDVDEENLILQQNHPLTKLRASLLSLNGEQPALLLERSMVDCVLAASQCTASIVEKYSDFHPQISRELSISFGKESNGKGDAMLNVHGGVGCGTLVGLHVGDDNDHVLEARREFLFLGDPIDQVSKAEATAATGEVFASKDVIELLKQKCHLEFAESDGPSRIAARDKCFFHPFQTKNSPPASHPSQELALSKQTHPRNNQNLMGEKSLPRLHRELSLYVHHVVRDDELNGLEISRTRKPSTDRQRDRHLAEAELRLVYTMFINANIKVDVTGDEEKDIKLFERLQMIMQVTCRELHERKGQLRQFIIDDKGVVLIGTFGLRGSTFPNMIPNYALPATFAIHERLKTELLVENTIGATAGKVYCGVVGGVHRHEFAVMGAPVNLAARLMKAKDNHGILVDETVQAGADSRFTFKRLPPVNAKGYDKPVIIFEPLPIHEEPRTKRRGFSHGFIGRNKDVAELTDVSKSIINDPEDSQTVMAFIIGEPGIGKSALGLCIYQEMKTYADLHRQKIFFYRSTSTETEQRIPLSSFRKVFLGAIRELCMQDGTLASYEESRMDRLDRMDRMAAARSERRLMERRGSMKPSRRMSIGGRAASRKVLSMSRKITSMDSNHSIHSIASMRSVRSVNVPYLKKLCDICEELDYPHEFADIVGSQLLGLDGANPTTHIEGRVPSIDEVVEFLSTAYIRLTKEYNLTMIFLDDFQWIDSFTWKVIRALCEKGKNILIMGAMRSQETQALRRMSSVASWHTRMQSRKGIIEVNIGPLETDEVKQMISRILDYEEHLIDDQLSNDIYQKTGGITIYVIELLESIKRNKTVAIDENTGLLQWTPEAAREQKRIGSNSVAAIELSFLNRFDSLDLGVRRVLQTCAVLGMSFSLTDVIRVHPEMVGLDLEQSLDQAVDELILVEDVEDDDDDDMSLWSGNSPRMESRNIGGSWNQAVEDRFFQFSHAMWRKSVLDAMLSEVKVHLHRTIAEALEKEQVLVMESSDIGWLLTLFDHWKSCGNFCKAAPLALAVGLRLEEWDLSAQSLDLYRDALEMCYESADNPDGGEPTTDENEVWLPASAPPATVEFILRLHIRIAKCHAHLGEQEQCATTFEDAYKIMTTSPKAAKLNQELVLPIISGLCSIAIQRNVVNSDLLSENEDLVDRFVREARERNDEIHIARALSMKASFFARLGNFSQAIAVQKELELIYKVELHSAGIRQEYGKDHAVQSYADSVQWYMLIENQPAAEQQANVVVTKLLPQFDLRDVDTVMELIFPILLVLKSIGRARYAETILFNNAINPFHDLGGSSSCWIKLFNPIAYLFELIKMIEEGERDDQMLAQFEDWVMDPSRSIFSIDLQYKGYALIGEICCHLARFKLEKDEDPQMVLERGRMVLTRVVYTADDDQSDAFMVEMARATLGKITDMEDEIEEANSEELDDEEQERTNLMQENKDFTRDSLLPPNSDPNISGEPFNGDQRMGKRKCCECTIQ